MAHTLTLFREVRARFRNWRRSRPFWGGLLLAAAGIEILVAPAAQGLILPIDLIVHAGIAGVSGTLIGLLLVAIGVLSWLQPAQHLFFGIVGVLLALASFVTSNFGGFLIGMLIGIVGGSLVCAWSSTARTGARGSRRAPGGKHRQEQVDDPEPRSGPLAAVALPLALVVTLAAVPAPNPGWPWDWLLPGEEEQSEEESDDGTGESDAPEEPGTGPGDDEDEDEDGEEAEEEDEDGSGDGEEAEEEGVAEDCEFRVGESGLTDDEDELLEAVRACQAAEEEESLPEVPVDDGYDCFHGSTRTSGLTADRLTMTGARYDGVVECSTDEGAQRYIRLSMNTADLSNGELWFEDAGTRMSLDLPTLSMDGEVTMHITRMHVRLLGIPLTFTPDFPPPLLLPFMVVTDIDVDSPMVGTDLMTISDLNSRHNENVT